ncbi:hypothetical protein P691DRAFT_783908 [Macrolepiota fuliginosa MF-IS2]|uniref:Uncharacterized protein n=1 Tax=Macrolepiota fuliginosa MF-IS2 TaxID=1400762 RepID=A0A9P5XS71_9AGAR|nr:hypothetical protein P691DRAFT_783908 [Macrolepiota fuliginosa MF-IS2]
MFSPSDSDPLPDIDQVIAASRNYPAPALFQRSSLAEKPPVINFKKSRRRKRKRPSSASGFSGPSKKQKNAASPIELTSEDEHPPRNVTKNNRRPPPTDVIDLCSDEETTPKPPRFTQKPKSRPPRDEDIIVLLDSDDEPPPDLPGPGPSKHVRLPENNTPVNGSGTWDRRIDTTILSQETSPVVISRESKTPASPHPIFQEAAQPTSPNSSISPPHLASVHEVSELLASPINHVNGPQSDDNEPTGPLQDIYDQALRNAHSDEETNFPRSAFSSRIRSKSHSTMKIPQHGAFSWNSPLPPLLTPSFFTRLQQAPVAPQRTTTPEIGDDSPPPLISPPRATTVKPGSRGTTPKPHSPERHVKSRSRTPQPPPSLDDPETMDIDEATNVIAPTEGVSEAAAVSPEASTPLANKIPSPSPPPPPPLTTVATTSQCPSPSPLLQEEKETASHRQNSTEETHTTLPPNDSSTPPTCTYLIPHSPAASSVPPHSLGQLGLKFPKQDILDTQMGDVEPGSSYLDMQEIADMLLPKSPNANGLTDEELIAIGLCYPESCG